MLELALLGLIADLFDSINWSAIGVPAAVVVISSVSFAVAKRISERAVATRTKELESQVKSSEEYHDVLQAKIGTLEVQLATQATMLENQHKTLTETQSKLQEKTERLNAVFHQGKQIYNELKALKPKYEQLRLEHDKARETIQKLEDAGANQDVRLKVLQDDLNRRVEQLKKAETRMRKVQRLSGYLVRAKALQARPKFRVLAERNRAIIAVAALKGGVGKTTLTAHLAGAMARKGYRVLLVDLDLQGSLSGLMLPHEVLHERVKKRRLMQDFFMNAMRDKTAKLTDYIVESPQPEGVPGSIHIVPASDQLAYAELNLTLGWLLKQGERDARFLLRRALHLKGANAKYDIVLLDCPPVLNISCANALAAADFLLIPTLLSAKSTERVPTLIARVQEEDFIKHLNSQLKVLGVVANRARYAEPTGQELVNWEVNLPQSLAVIQNQHTKLFKTIVAQDKDISANEEQYVHPRPNDRAGKMFTQLLNELEQELPDACRRSCGENS